MVIVIIGGGAAGLFGALACAEAHPTARVIILEKTRQLLSKVKISGGGRCNVTHACFDPIPLTQNYPRGNQALKGPFTRFQPEDTVAWFSARGVVLKTEADGRMFPITDQSETIIQCLLQEAKRLKIEIRLESEVISIEKGFCLHLKGDEKLFCDRILLATGGNRKGHELAQSLGHRIIPAVPSLFTFNITDPRLEDLAGVAVPKTTVHLMGTSLKTTGPLLITHWGMSGPAILKLSAWGARALADCDYKAQIQVNWLFDAKESAVISSLEQASLQFSKKKISSEPLFGLPKKLWHKLVIAAQIDSEKLYAHLSKKERQNLASQLCQATFSIHGKSTYKEEFVTCGGIDLNEVNFKTMESRLCPGLFFAGEVLDIDGVTGGFNFQNAWTTAFIAGQSLLP